MASDSNLVAMGLTPMDPTDEYVRYGNHDKRTTFMNAVKNTDTGLADYQEIWQTNPPSDLVNKADCNTPIWIAKVSAVVIEGHTDGKQDKPLNARYYLCKEETATWAKKYLRFSVETANNKLGLRSTAPYGNYDIKKYDMYIPRMIRDASAKYKTKFFNHHSGQNPKLTEEMITISFTSFMCHLHLGNQRAIDEHVEDIHGFTNGVDELKEDQRIQVDSKIAFTLPSLLDIELMGPDKRKSKFHEVYVICVARDILKKNSNEANSDLNRSRSVEFMGELKKSTSNTYYERFKMHLKNLIGFSEDIDGSFSCKYEHILSALTSAVNKEQDTVRLENFLNTTFETFHSLPLELLIGNVDKYVDSVQGTSTAVSQDSEGRTISKYTFCILWKYKLIFNIAAHLPGDMRQIKEIIKNKVTEMYEGNTPIMTIPKFQEFLISEFEKKSLLSTFRNEVIPAPKKGLSVNEASVGKGKGKFNKDDKEEKPDNPEDLEKFKAEFSKIKLNNNAEKANVKAIKEKALQMAKDPNNAELCIMDHPELKAFLREKKLSRGCWYCLKANCFQKQMLGKKYKVKVKKSDECKGTRKKFKDLEENTTTSPPTAENNSAHVTSTNNFENVNHILAGMDENDETTDCDINFQENIVGIYANTEFTRDKIPDDMDFDSQDTEKTKTCPLCNKDRMHYRGLHSHLNSTHNITWGLGEEFESPLEDWIAAFHAAVEYDPTTDQTKSDDSSDSSAEPKTYSSVEYISDDLEADVTSPVKKQKRRKNRPSQNDANEKIEFKYEEVNAKIEQNSIRLENVDRNIDTLTSSARSFQNEIKNDYRLKSEAMEKRITNSHQEKWSSIKRTIENMSDNICKSEEKVRNMNEASIKHSMQELSERICNSEENLKKELSSITGSSNKILEGKISKLSDYIAALEMKLEGQNRTPSTNNQPSGHGALDSASNSVQKPQDNPPQASVESYSHEQSNKKDTMELPPHNEYIHKAEETISDGPETEVNTEEKDVPAETKQKENDAIKGVKGWKRRKLGVRSSKKEKKKSENNSQEQNCKFEQLKNERKMKKYLFNAPGVIWIVIFVLSFLAARVAGSPASEIQPGNKAITSLISSQNTKEYITIYSLNSLEAINYQYSMDEVKMELISAMESACSAIPILHQACVDHPSSCQSTNLSIKNQENSIRKHAQSLSTLERICEVSDHPISDEIIHRCNQGQNWSPKESPAEKFHLLSDMFESFTSEFLQDQKKGTSIIRHKRFVVSVPVVVATAIGASSLATAGVTAAVIAHQETNKVIEEVKANRIEDIEYALYNNNINLNVSSIIAKDLDSIRFTGALATDAVNSYNHAVQLNNQISHLFSESEVIEFSSPFTESWFRGIVDINKKNSIGLTKSELMEKSRISADITSLVTTLVPLNNRSHQCSDMMLLKTLIVPTIDHKSRIEVHKENGTIRRRYGSNSSHIVISNNAAVSKETRMFGTTMSVVGRTCEIANSVNATSSQSSDPLMEHFSFSFDGNLTLEERCPSNGSHKSFTWTFTSLAVIELPITCSLTSTIINCRAINIKAGHTKESHIAHYRMKIVKTDFDEKVVNKTKFVRPDVQKKPKVTINQPNILDYAKWPVIGSGIAICVLLAFACIGMTIKKRSNSKVSVNIENNSSPTFKIENSSHGSQAINPSAPTLSPSPEKVKNKEENSSILTLQDGINAIRAIRSENRTPFHDRDLRRYVKELESQQSSASPDEQA